MLSFSTRGSSTSPAAQRVAAAASLARQRIEERQAATVPAFPTDEVEIDGELQADTALDPDLNSGNISTKLLQGLASVCSYGQILLGLSRPAADVSRGATAETILGVTAIVGLQAIEYHTLYRD